MHASSLETGLDKKNHRLLFTLLYVLLDGI